MDGKKLEYRGEEALKDIERLTTKADEVQKNILKEILTRNRETEYLAKYMKGSKDILEFKRSVPIITYMGIRPYIQRIANGEDSSLITGHPITEMLCSSGTSAGEPKMMPSIAEDLNRRTFLYNLIMPIMNQCVPGLDEGKAMYLYFIKAETSTPCGLPARAVLTSYYKSKHFKGRARDSFNDYTSPDQAILCNDSNQSMYCQLLAGLIHRHQVLRLGAVFASAFLRAISFLERNWVRLCNDIRTGQLDPAITDPNCLSCMSSMLSTPNPHLADEIERICSRSSWKGVLSHLWPRAKYIEAVVTGSMAQYIPSLGYYSDWKLPLVSTMYASSECYFGVNLKPLCDPADVAFTLMPNMGYFEFIPLGENGTMLMTVGEEEEVPNDKVLDLVQVRLGCYYELVVTTFAGLYRYRIGDVLQVTGFHNRAPQFRFICRRNVLLSIDNDKTNEEDLHKSITVAKKLLEPYNALLVEYTSYADTSTFPGHYVLYWEIIQLVQGSKPDDDHDGQLAAATHAVLLLDHHDEVLQECCIAVEEELDYIYRRCRAYDKCVGPLEIRVVAPGTFEKLMDLFIDQGGSINQYKTPRCIKSQAALKLLNSHVKASFFSPRDPKWFP
ncbi:putative indole-3-acetic acid-amido synthetase GH3.9 [Juglans regia]|uniref:Indole-3-acetic acid-amido synthetase GH3.9 n=2 Tax=Juglans regia TaxID=51240 RepID=A0A2I4DWG9_JUGRE|nr:putative indole-3-acetic acid-amido synthetase GH3.9 [Juglans regia]